MAPLRFFNTLTRTTEDFVPLREGKVGIYSCGPTVYSEVHIGNLRTFLWNDLLRRYLVWKGFDVTFVMNITDIDDKIIRDSAAAGESLETFTERYTEGFFRNLDALRIRRADIHPKATDHIDEMVGIITRLGENGHTYQSEGSTYFEIATWKEYGRLSRLDLGNASSQSRLDSDEYDKDDARDFALWKAKKAGEPSWETPIGAGRPGWHIECSAMAMKYLGSTFDIHTGAVDLIFPHHENEIAQSEGATGVPFVRYWLHGEHLIMQDQKMSKSLGNVYRLSELLDEGYTPLQVRHALLSVPYRTRLNFTTKSLEDSAQALERLELFLLRMDEIADGSSGDDGNDDLARRLRAGFEDAMDDDLNTAAALGAIFTILREVNSLADQGRLAASDARSIAGMLRSIDEVLDLLPRREALDDEIQALVDARDQARRSRNFAESDRLRDELASRGIILEDTPSGTRWRRKS
ncbi:MAG: cysteine--tRNA ligase [Acidobacteria bacterium]|nr:cysteine--tRNA ligase [Acidobacteriota bacterium]